MNYRRLNLDVTPHRSNLGERLRSFGESVGKAAVVAQDVYQEKKTADEKAYFADVDREMREGLTAIANENPNNVNAFNEKAEALINGMSKNIDQQYTEVFKEKSTGLQDDFRLQVIGNQAKNNREARKQTHLGNIQTTITDAKRLQRNGNAEQMAQALIDAKDSYDALIEDGFLTEAQADELYKKDAREIAEEGFLNDIESQVDLDSKFERLIEISEKVPAGWSPDQWESFVSRGFKQLSQEARIEAANAQVLEQEQYDQNLLLHAENIISNGYPVDPKKTTDQAKYDVESLDFYFDNVSKEWASLPANEQIKNVSNFVNSTGIIPKSLESRVNATARSGDVDQVLLMSEIMSRIQEETPQAIYDLPDETKAIMLSVSDSRKAGTDTEQALEIARKNAYGMSEQEREAIRIKSSEYVKDLPSKLQDKLEEFDVSYFSEEADAPPVMQADYKVLFDKYMNYTGGDTGQAETLAYNDLKRTWGETKVGGRRFMKYAPEAIYNIPGIDNSWINEQWEEDTKGMEGAVMVADTKTARGKKPTYVVMVPNENTGVLEPAFDEQNRPLRWYPDYSKTEYYQDAIELPGKSIEKAVKQRDINNQRKMNSQINMVNMGMSRGGRSEESVINNAVVLGKINEIDAKKLKEYYGIN